MPVRLTADPSGSLQAVREFIAELAGRGFASWTDDSGDTLVRFGAGTVRGFLRERYRLGETLEVLSMPGLSIDNLVRTDAVTAIPDWVLAVGGAREQAAGRERIIALGSTPKLASAPAILSNDSFCTDRGGLEANGPSGESRPTTYPREILLDPELLAGFELRQHLPGIGEVIGLYTSMRDYFDVRGLKTPSTLEEMVPDVCRALLESWMRGPDVLLRELALGLILKCLVMRVEGNHHIGAGGDHLIAYALTPLLDTLEIGHVKHGQLVLLGAITMLALFPEWELTSLTAENLAAFGKASGLVSGAQLAALTNMDSVIGGAVRARPARPSRLRDVSAERRTNAVRQIRGLLDKS